MTATARPPRPAPRSAAPPPVGGARAALSGPGRTPADPGSHVRGAIGAARLPEAGGGP